MFLFVRLPSGPSNKKLPRDGFHVMRPVSKDSGTFGETPLVRMRSAKRGQREGLVPKNEAPSVVPQITLTRLGAGLQMWRCRRKGPGQIPETGDDRTGRDRFADVELNALDALKALRLITLGLPC
ncbi:hypothetical protein VTJ04DRAFT_3389 [Mycothermus thermophilus]|uniref:uncharacterized protein n=1 Tax=Humicola insolens TaxID=85995 RepID=UPI0037443145